MKLSQVIYCHRFRGPVQKFHFIFFKYGGSRIKRGGGKAFSQRRISSMLFTICGIDSGTTTIEVMGTRKLLKNPENISK